jgi:hypothetical protein
MVRFSEVLVALMAPESICGPLPPWGLSAGMSLDITSVWESFHL